MDESPILVDKRDGYRVITLNRPQRLNSFTEAMHHALKAARIQYHHYKLFVRSYRRHSPKSRRDEWRVHLIVDETGAIVISAILPNLRIQNDIDFIFYQVIDRSP